MIWVTNGHNPFIWSARVLGSGQLSFSLAWCHQPWVRQVVSKNASTKIPSKGQRHLAKLLLQVFHVEWFGSTRRWQWLDCVRSKLQRQGALVPQSTFISFRTVKIQTFSIHHLQPSLRPLQILACIVAMMFAIPNLPWEPLDHCELFAGQQSVTMGEMKDGECVTV